MKFRKKPVVIDAITFEELVEHGRRETNTAAPKIPWSFKYKGHAITNERDDCYLIPTLEGMHNMTPGDMLITGVNGEIYPCKLEIFNKTYDAVPLVVTGRGVSGIHGTFDHRQIDSARFDTTTSPGDPLYRIAVYRVGHLGDLVQFSGEIKFQDGPIQECGLNGWTNEDLLIIVADRLKSFQASRFACQENADALKDVNDALSHLNSRTKRRSVEGVEGTHKT